MTIKQSPQQYSQHGVLMSVAGKGILIVGDAGVGKSSFALELLYHGHQLIADDIVDIHIIDHQLCGRCPPMLENILYSRELGLISIPTVFSPSAWQSQHQIDYVVKLQTDYINDYSLSKETPSYSVLDTSLPLLNLTINSPATLTHRLHCWLSMQAVKITTDDEFKHRQHLAMVSS